MEWVISFLLLIGVNFSIWSFVGLARLFKKRLAGELPKYINQTELYSRWFFIIAGTIGVIDLFYRINELPEKLFWRMNNSTKNNLKSPDLRRTYMYKKRLRYLSIEAAAKYIMDLFKSFFYFPGAAKRKKNYKTDEFNNTPSMLRLARYKNNTSPEFLSAYRYQTTVGYYSAIKKVATTFNINAVDVAAIVPAHNEEKTINKTISSLKKNIAW